MTARRHRYRKRPGKFVTAVRLDLEIQPFTYRKWGGVQRCEPGDWVVNNGGDTYTVAHEVFASTYVEVSPGVFEKPVVVWAEEATRSGSIRTREGTTDYQPGDFLVHNLEDGSDSYAVCRSKFMEMYERLRPS